MITEKDIPAIRNMASKIHWELEMRPRKAGKGPLVALRVTCIRIERLCDVKASPANVHRQLEAIEQLMAYAIKQYRLLNHG